MKKSLIMYRILFYLLSCETEDTQEGEEPTAEDEEAEGEEDEEVL